MNFNSKNLLKLCIIFLLMFTLVLFIDAKYFNKTVSTFVLKFFDYVINCVLLYTCNLIFPMEYSWDNGDYAPVLLILLIPIFSLSFINCNTNNSYYAAQIVRLVFCAVLYFVVCCGCLKYYNNPTLYSASFWASQIILGLFLGFNYLFFTQEEADIKSVGTQSKTWFAQFCIIFSKTFIILFSYFILFNILIFVGFFIFQVWSQFSVFKSCVLYSFFYAGNTLAHLVKNLVLGQYLIGVPFFFAYKFIKEGFLDFPSKLMDVYSYIGFIMFYIILPIFGYHAFGFHLLSDSSYSFDFETGLIPLCFNPVSCLFIMLHILFASYVFFSFTKKIYGSKFLHFFGYVTLIILQVFIYFLILALLYRFCYYLYSKR